MKEYIGDSVYVELNEAGQVVLTTENGFGPSNTIYLEPEVFNALNEYVFKLTRAKLYRAMEFMETGEGEP